MSATTIHRSVVTAHTPEQMFDLVNDVEHYPEFLPWCRQGHVLEQQQDSLVAQIDFALGGVRRSFTTFNQLRRPEAMDIELIEGPFRALGGHWQFRAVPQGCEVALDLHFELAGGWLNRVLGPLLRPAADSLVGAFCKRADEVYGAA